jgi:hypothetical protein
MAEYIVPYKESKKITVNIDSSINLGLYALLNWLDGFEAKGGQVPGHFELLMFFRTLQSEIGNEKNKEEE